MVAFGEHRSTSAKTPPPKDRPPAPAPPPPPRWRMALIVLGVLLTVLLLLRPSMGSGTPNHDYSYSRFVRAVTNDKVRSATIDSNGKVTGSLKNGDDYTSQIPTALRDLQLAPPALEAQGERDGEGAAGDVAALDPAQPPAPAVLRRRVHLVGAPRSQADHRRDHGHRRVRGRRSTTRSGRRRASPTSPGTTAPRREIRRSSTS